MEQFFFEHTSDDLLTGRLVTTRKYPQLYGVLQFQFIYLKYFIFYVFFPFHVFLLCWTFHLVIVACAIYIVVVITIRILNENKDKLIAKYGYPAEVHQVTTEDGYILTMHRIRGKQGAQPFFLQHGLVDSSAGYVIMGPNVSLGKCVSCTYFFHTLYLLWLI